MTRSDSLAPSKPDPAALRAACRRLLDSLAALSSAAGAETSDDDSPPSHPAAFGATDRELVRLATGTPSIEADRHDALRRLGGFRRPG